jgi:ATP synthase protein I
MTPGKMLRWASVGVEFSSPIVGGAIVGHYLDLYFKTDPWLTLIMFLLGVLAGFIRLIRSLAEFQRES